MANTNPYYAAYVALLFQELLENLLWKGAFGLQWSTGRLVQPTFIVNYSGRAWLEEVVAESE